MNALRLPAVALVAFLGLVAASCATGSAPVRETGGAAFCGAGQVARLDAAAASVATLTAYDVVAQRCPVWLSKRGRTSLYLVDEVVVYADGVRVGGPEALRLFPAADVEGVRRLSAADATFLFGWGHGAGALLVETRRR